MVGTRRVWMGCRDPAAGVRVVHRPVRIRVGYQASLVHGGRHVQGANAAGDFIFSGDLYVTNGPYFGGAFNPDAVSNRRVGTLTFRAVSVTTGVLTYSVDGVVVVKNISRQTWRFENLSGSYFGGLIYDASQCFNAANNGHREELGTLAINHLANNTVTITSQTQGGNCTYTANYTQDGHMGACRVATRAPMALRERSARLNLKQQLAA